MSSAEDLAQETFFRAWRGLGRLEDLRAFGSWLLSTAGFVCHEWIRRKRTAERHRMEAPREAADGPAAGPDLPLAEAVAGLAPEVQHLLALRHDRGLSCEEIARTLGKPLGTVTKTLSRAYAELRERLAVRT
jgi:RNA polymerase sigma-70 factor (ECF subfamily)